MKNTEKFLSRIHCHRPILYFLAILFFFTTNSCSSAPVISPENAIIPETPEDTNTPEIKTPGDGSITDKNILYVGRWDKSDNTVFHSYWTGAYLRVNFTGKSIGIKLHSNTSLVVSIDGETPRAVVGQSGITLLNTTTLSEGTHTLLVGSAGQNYEVEFEGLVLDKNAVTYPPDKKLLIEYIGDSITAFGGSDNTPTVNYAWQTAELLGCDHTQISFSGLSLSSEYGCLDTKIGMDSLYFNLKNYNHIHERPVIPWNFSYTPDIVFIFLGTNDECGQAPEEVVSLNSRNMIYKIRQKFNDAEIFVMRPFKGIYENVLSSAVRRLNSMGDEKIHFIDTTGWLSESDFSDGTHPNETGTSKIINKLVPTLKPFVKNNF